MRIEALAANLLQLQGRIAEGVSQLEERIAVLEDVGIKAAYF